MYTPLKTRIAPIVGSIIASVLVTFTLVDLIASQALPGPAASSAPVLVAKAATPTR